MKFQVVSDLFWTIQAVFVVSEPICGPKILSWALKTFVSIICKKIEWLITHVTAAKSPSRAKYENFQITLNLFLAGSIHFCGQ